jgi:hypothetical protein
MTWVTRPGIRVNRTATAWLIRRFIDPAATFLFVDAQEVAATRRSRKAGFLYDALYAALKETS